MKRKTITERIRAYIAAHPDAKPKEVAAAVKCNVANVYALRYKKVEPLKAEQIKAEPIKESVDDLPQLPTTVDYGAGCNAAFTVGAATAFLSSVLTREELVGAYKTFSTLSTASLDVVNTNMYAEWLREVLSSR